nr:MerR family transcriptional regulator [uncultured Anaeromusa sp.]
MAAVLIRELSRRTGASIRSLRHYEEKGLLAPQRLENGYRDYAEPDIGTVKTIQLYLGLGLSTEAIVMVLECPQEATTNRPLCKEAYRLYQGKLAEVERQLKMLQTLQARLQERISQFENAANVR